MDPTNYAGIKGKSADDMSDPNNESQEEEDDENSENDDTVRNTIIQFPTFIHKLFHFSQT